jgi:hypothetical protein
LEEVVGHRQDQNRNKNPVKDSADAHFNPLPTNNKMAKKMGAP